MEGKEITKQRKAQLTLIKKAKDHAKRGDHFFTIFFLDKARNLGPVHVCTERAINDNLKAALRKIERGAKYAELFRNGRV